MTREPCRSGYEQDCIYARRVYCYTQRPGVVSAAKRAIRRRERRSGQRETREQELER